MLERREDVCLQVLSSVLGQMSYETHAKEIAELLGRSLSVDLADDQ